MFATPVTGQLLQSSPRIMTRRRCQPKRHGVRYGAAVGGIMVMF
jgi:hypothetical protein